MKNDNQASRLHLGIATLALSIVGTVGIILACGGGEATERAAPGAAPAPGGAACAKDTDCKGDRICSDGKCVSPR